MNTRAQMKTALGIALCLVGSLSAAAASSESGEHIPPSAWSSRIFALADAELDDGDASYAISSVAFTAQHRHWSLGVERQHFAWRNGEDFPSVVNGQEPWEFLNRIQLGYAHKHVHSDRWTSEIMVGGVAGFEDEMRNSFSGYAGGYGLYRVNPDLMCVIGFLFSKHQKVATDLDNLPIVGVLWSPTALQGFSAQLGFPKTHACWAINARNRLLLELNTLEGGVVRLADDSPVQEKGYVEFTSAALTLRLETRVGENLDLSVGVGHSVHREMKVFDTDGKRQQSIDVERGPSIEIGISKPF